jgi:hypothetical protein
MFALLSGVISYKITTGWLLSFFVFGAALSFGAILERINNSIEQLKK